MTPSQKASRRAKEAIRGYLKVLRKYREPIPIERNAEIRPLIMKRVAVTI